MRDLTCEPDTEVSGENIRAILDNLQAGEIAPFLDKYNLADVRAGNWYPLRDFLGLLDELRKNPNASPNFVAIGMGIAELGAMPPGMENASAVDILQGWNEHYQMAHRYVNIWHKTAERVSDKHYRVIMDNCVYPDDLEYGVLYGFMKRFLPQHTSFTVWYDKDVKRLDQGGTQTVLHVRWE
jgi:hypothetical protein